MSLGTVGFESKVDEARTALGRRAAALQPLLAKNADETERQRRVVEENIEAIEEAGLFGLLTPERLGGHGADSQTLLDVTAQLGRGCGSTAWVVGILASNAWMRSLYPEQAQKDVWADGSSPRSCGNLTPTSESRRVDGGLRFSGKWPFSSGCYHSDWATVGVQVVSSDGAHLDDGIALVPMSELSIEDTWFVAGMRGTGSNTLVADDVFVPDHRIISTPDAVAGAYPREHREEPLARIALAPLLTLAIVGPQLGLASAALDFVLEKAHRRGISYTSYERQAQSVGFQAQVGEAGAKIDAAYLIAQRAADEIDQAAARAASGDEGLDTLARVRIRMACSHAVELCGEAIDSLVSAHGTASFADPSPLQRIWRDQSTARRHAFLGSRISQEVYGRALLGLDPTDVTEIV